MVKQETSERRVWIRAKRVLSLQYRLYKSNGKRKESIWHLSTTQDISVGGVSFYTDQEYKTGDVLQIHITMSGVLDIFKGLGEIVRVEKKKTASFALIGLKFIDQKLPKRDAKAYTSSLKLKSSVRKRSAKRI